MLHREIRCCFGPTNTIIKDLTSSSNDISHGFPEMIGLSAQRRLYAIGCCTIAAPVVLMPRVRGPGALRTVPHQFGALVSKTYRAG